LASCNLNELRVSAFVHLVLPKRSLYLSCHLLWLLPLAIAITTSCLYPSGSCHPTLLWLVDNYQPIGSTIGRSPDGTIQAIAGGAVYAETFHFLLEPLHVTVLWYSHFISSPSYDLLFVNNLSCLPTNAGVSRTHPTAVSRSQESVNRGRNRGK